MNLRTFLICGLICGCGVFTSCTSSNEDTDIVATQVADGTMPPWLVESGGGYTDVSNESISYTPPPRPSNSKASSSSSKSKTSTSSSKKKTPSKSRTYTVVKGDVIERIARRHGVSTKALLKANNLKAESIIRPGQVLRIP